MKGNLIAIGIGVLLAVVIIAVNYYDNHEKNVAYMETYGNELRDGEWKK